MDAQYFLIRDDINLLKWVNDNLIEAVQWQEDPLIKHDTVHLGGELGVLWPNWSNEITIPNYVDNETIKEIITKGVNKYNEKCNKN